jgi:hypothetical protein
VIPVRYELDLSVLLKLASTSQLTVSRMSKQCGIRNITQTYRPPPLVTRIALLFNVKTKQNHSLKSNWNVFWSKPTLSNKPYHKRYSENSVLLLSKLNLLFC